MIANAKEAINLLDQLRESDSKLTETLLEIMHPVKLDAFPNPYDHDEDSRSGVIIARLEKEGPPYGACPVVLMSDHPRFTKGTRFDFGFLSIALREGYSVVFIGNRIEGLQE